MSDFVETFLNVDLFAQAWRFLALGALRTLALSALVVPLGLVAGLACAMIAHHGGGRARVVAAFVDLFRSLPPLVLLVLIYAGLPFAKIDLGAWGSVGLCFLLNAGAYYGEILRAGLKGVPAGQFEAARALGLPRIAVWGRIVLPQAVRVVAPDLLSNTLEVVKLTSIAAVVGLPELLYQARQIQSTTYNATPIVAASVFYFVALWPFVRLLSTLEARRLQRAQ